jgi:hypothetical protein
MTQIVPFFQSNFTDWEPLLTNATFSSLVVPEFECADFEGTEVIEWAKLQIQQDTNRARAGGVDTNNINGLVAEFQHGYRVTELPPIVMILPDGTMELWDGYNRSNAAYQLGVSDYPFLVYRLRGDWASCVEDAYDMVSLSANNHTVSKRHTINDFVLRGVQYCKRHENSLTKDEITSWVATINHSFTPKQVADIVNKIYQQTTIAVNIAPFVHPKNAQAKVSEIVDNQTSTNPVIVCAKEDTYIERAYLQIVKNLVFHNIDQTEVVTYTKGCETAEEVVDQRNHVPEYLAELDSLFMQYAIKRLTLQSSAYVIAGALPQLIGVEDPQSLVELN